MHIERSVVDVREFVSGVLRSVDAAVLCIALFWEGLPKGRIEELEDLAGILQGLEKHIGHEQGIDGKATKKDSPEDWMGSLYQSVRELN